MPGFGYMKIVFCCYVFTCTLPLTLLGSAVSLDTIRYHSQWRTCAIQIKRSRGEGDRGDMKDRVIAAALSNFDDYLSFCLRVAYVVHRDQAATLLFSHIDAETLRCSSSRSWTWCQA
ncbi:mCG17500, isoform CRA_c [Mus musculus]|uniref:Uncharacterized protein n=1 Tax=Mus musculus TaxID=10090 RepID=Q9DAB2_MOUSE|nr:mCG17500, isoform CRA_c [Mus musculus]BAB24359.1 unnamed protein product [Mus musculus]